jgi:glycine hydroxymethyltransferase
MPAFDIDNKQEDQLQVNSTKSGVPNEPLEIADPEIYNLIKQEEDRQRNGLELIASENFTSRAVMEAVGSCLTNKYSEGLPGKRYYGGNEYIDKIERICIRRALVAFNLDPKEWAVNVQAYSGSVANFALFTAMMQPGDRFMGLHLPDGGHLSHGFYTPTRAINISSMYFTSMPYRVDLKTGYIDYDDMEETALRFRPKMIIVGGSAYPRDWDYARVRKICDKVKAYLHCDMAHYSGLVASGVLKNPFLYADVVTTTTHKSLRSTRAALIFCKKEFEKQVNAAVFPGVQGGPHNHAIAGIAVQLAEVATPEFREYSRQVVKNCRYLASCLESKGYKMQTGGTDTHLILWDLRPLKLTGSKMSKLCDAVCITLNKNTVPGDKSALIPGGVRVGTPALTSRGFKETDFQQVAEFLHRVVLLASEIDCSIPGDTRKLKDFKAAMSQHSEKINALREEVVSFAGKFPIPGKIL